MSVIRLTKEFSFEMAHALEGYDGACSQIHGHSYKLFVTVAGEPLADPSHPKYGMVMDFGVLKELVNRLIVSRYDHALVIRDTEGNRPLVETLRSRFDRIEAVDYQPTCENMVARFAAAVAAELPEGVSLRAVRMHETATSYAEWLSCDNG